MAGAAQCSSVGYFSARQMSVPESDRRQPLSPSREGEARWRTLLEKTRDWVWEMDLDGRHTYSNRQVELILGYTAEELGELALSQLLHPEDAREVAERLPALIDAKSGWQGWTVRFRHRDGSYRRLESSAEPLLDAAGEVRGFRGVDRDITERRRIELAIEKLVEATSSTVGESFFESVVKHLAEVLEADVVFIGELVGPGGKGGRIEPRAAYADGGRAEGFAYDLENTPCASVVGQKPCIYTAGVRWRFPEDALLEELGIEGYIGVPLFDSAGLALGLIVALSREPIAGPDSALAIVELIAERTVTEIERQRAEEALRKSERRYRQLFERNLAGVFRTTEAGGILECNDALARILGAESARELLARRSPDLWDAPNREAFLSALREARELRNFESTLRRLDGTAVHVLGNVSLLTDGEGERTIEGTLIDVSERRELEDQLRHAHKMEAIGRLAGGVAHDFNNLLTAIAGYAELGLARAAADDGLADYFRQIQKAGELGATLTRQLLAFSRQQVLEPTVVDLNGVVTEFAELLDRTLGEDIELVTVLDGALGAVKADAGQMAQILMNLAVNARDAMPRGGRLVIETANVTLDDAYARSHSEVKAGDYVVLTVTDEGDGMDPETRSRVFDPFFTTKEVGKGTGLGLATVYGIVKQSQGFIWVYSEPGESTAFKIYLPRLAGERTPELPKDATGRSTVGAATILLVEDSEQLRGLLARSLAAEGHEILEAASAEEALAIASAHDGTIDLLLTDLILPTENGLQLAERLTREREAMRVVLMSGYTGNALPEGYSPPVGIPLLTKPFAMAELARAVRRVLAARR